MKRQVPITFQDSIANNEHSLKPIVWCDNLQTFILPMSLLVYRFIGTKMLLFKGQNLPGKYLKTSMMKGNLLRIVIRVEDRPYMIAHKTKVFFEKRKFSRKIGKFPLENEDFPRNLRILLDNTPREFICFLICFHSCWSVRCSRKLRLVRHQVRHVFIKVEVLYGRL